MNPVPLTVTVVAAAPATALDGVTDVTVGLGLLEGVGVGVVVDDPPPPPPQADRNIAATRATKAIRTEVANRCKHTSENIELGPWVMRKEVGRTTECKAE